jgi:endonuclease YncB( thermonuclease family)
MGALRRDTGHQALNVNATLRQAVAALGLFVALSMVPAASPADLIGQASIIDGDTIEVHGQRIRLIKSSQPHAAQARISATRSAVVSEVT